MATTTRITTEERELRLAARLAELERLAKQREREAFVARFPHPGDFALSLQPSVTKQTPALQAIDRELRQVAEGSVTRLMLFVPPQEGKSTRTACWYPFWRIVSDPTLRIAIVSYSQGKAARWGKWIRRMIEAHPEFGVELVPGSRAADKFETTAGGQILSVGIEGGITGEPVDELIIDDPVRGRAEAESPTYRDAAWEWWESNAMTRASSRFKVILMMCMTGDTPVLLPDGTERSLRDIRPGDEVATYEGGRLATSTVMNWANQGPDDLFRIKMKSGRVVRANARHPFLTIGANGEEWLRTDQIQPGVRILTATGGNGAESSALPTTATSQLAAKECATPITARLAGHPATARHQSTQPPVVEHASSTATDLPTKRSMFSSTGKAEGAPSAVNLHRAATPEPTGTESCASITTTSLAESGGCSATTATLLSGTGGRPRSFGPLLTTWSVTPDEVIAVEACGREDVFDLQIDRTENFIANGLVSHNTRWHADDLAGRLLKEEPGDWKVLRIPALREDADYIARGHDGQSVFSGEGELISVQDRAPGWFRKLKDLRSQYVWLSVYAQSPVAAEGNLFRKEDFRYWYRLRAQKGVHDGMSGYRFALDGFDGPVRFAGTMTRFITMDLAASTKTSADWTVAAAWAVDSDGSLFLLDVARRRVQEGEHFSMLKPLAAAWNVRDIYVERGFIGTTLVIDATKSGYAVKPLSPDRDKITRALPAVDKVRRGEVYLPQGVEWLGDYLSEMAEFPQGSHDDQVDCTSYAVRVLAAHWLAPAAPQTVADRARQRLAGNTDAQVAFQAQTGYREEIDYFKVSW